MVAFETFGKRQKKLRGDIPDVYIYDNLPQSFRVQIIHLTSENLGDLESYNDHYGYGETVRSSYQAIVDILRKELGVFYLPPSTNYTESYIEELSKYILHEKSAEHVLSALELICRIIENVTINADYRHIRDAEKNSKEAIAEINARLKEHGIGYEYNGEIIRIDTELVHAEAVKPALRLLRDANYAGAEQEFLSAYGHYRKGNHKEAINDALKSFESTMKCIYDKRGWTYSKNDPAAKLIKVAFDNGIVPSFWESHFSALRTTLEAGVPTGRNKLSGHGQGYTPTDIPPHLTAYTSLRNA
jgi:AbiJ N-terminal domain 4